MFFQGFEERATCFKKQHQEIFIQHSESPWIFHTTSRNQHKDIGTKLTI